MGKGGERRKENYQKVYFLIVPATLSIILKKHGKSIDLDKISKNIHLYGADFGYQKVLGR